MSGYPRAVINLAALQHNLQRVRQLAPHSQIMSVIKADAYGHGILPVAQALVDSDAFAVARLSEGIALREQGIKKAIILLEGVSDAEELKQAATHHLIPVIHQATHVDLLLQTRLTRPLPFCWLMLETGMHRLGLPPQAIRHAILKLKDKKSICAGLGLMSHFANSDLIGDPRNDSQLEMMQRLADESGLSVCMANSAAVCSFSASHHQWVRPGLMLYGVSPLADKNGIDLGLKPVMQVQSKLIAIHQLQKGDEVGYGGDWTASGPCRMGVVSIGYGDGFNRQLTNSGAVLINDSLLPVLGRVSMDTICIALNECPSAKIGDEVIIWGAQNLPVEWQAKQAGTIAYELMTMLTARVKREYRNG